MTSWHNDIDYKLALKVKLENMMASACDRIFSNYRMLTPQFVIKQSEKGCFPMHQDWSIVDESKYVSFILWIPLHDVDETNGAVWAIKKSHLLNRKIRGSGYLFPNYSTINSKDIEPYITKYKIKAGEALIFYHSTIHGSPNNFSNSNREALQVSIIPKSAPFPNLFSENMSLKP
jgi:ectoine hydroxylase-related dioxygenase (phytanoyl-CoA dioxygenase family)